MPIPTMHATAVNAMWMRILGRLAHTVEMGIASFHSAFVVYFIGLVIPGNSFILEIKLNIKNQI